MASAFGLTSADKDRVARAFSESHKVMMEYCNGKVTPKKLRRMGEWAASPEVSAFLDLVFSLMGSKSKKRLVMEWAHIADFFDAKLADYIPMLFEKPELAVNPRLDAANHLIIKGDNLPALLALRPVYEGRVKCIIIDPPYLTGNDNLYYNDKFSHSAWLTMMALRLRIARDLMSNDASIIVHIDEREQAYLAVLMDQIFGRGARMMNFVWKKKKGGSNNSKHGATEHEYVLIYGKSPNHTSTLFLARKSELNRRFNQEDKEGMFQWDTFRAGATGQHYAIEMPDGTFLENDEDGEPISWLRSESRMLSDVAKGDVEFVQNSDGSWRVRYKRRPPARTGILPRSLLTSDEFGTTKTGGEDYIKVMGTSKTLKFLFPKPVNLIKYLVGLATQEGDIVLDFFAGSGTTGQAVLELNAEDGKERRFILVTDAGLASTEGPSKAQTKKQKANAVDIAEEITRVRMQRVISGEGWRDGGTHAAHEAGLQFFEVGYVPTKGAEVVDYTDDGEEVYGEDEVAYGHQELLDAVTPHLGEYAKAMYGGVTVHSDEKFSVAVGRGQVLVSLRTLNGPDSDPSLYDAIVAIAAQYGGNILVPAPVLVKYEWMERLATELGVTCRAVPIGAKLIRHWSVYNALREDS